MKLHSLLMTGSCFHRILEIVKRIQSIIILPQRSNLRNRPVMGNIPDNVTTALPPLWSSGQRSWLQNGDVLCLV
jgi:hypothetical protein